MRPKHLAMNLSKLQPHPCTDVTLEQYATEGDLAAYWLLAVEELVLKEKPSSIWEPVTVFWDLAL